MTSGIFTAPNGGRRRMETPGEQLRHGLFPSRYCSQVSKTSDIKLYKRPTRKGSYFKGFTDNECEKSFSDYLQSKFDVEVKEKEEIQLERMIFMINGLSCADCSLTFSSSTHLEKHQRLCQSSLPFDLESLDILEDLLQEPSSGMLICPKCPILCSSIRTLKKHVPNCKEFNRRPNQNQFSSRPAYLGCCSKSSDTNLEAMDSQVNGYSCIECSFKAANLETFLPHLQSHYLSDLVCTSCNSQYSTVIMLLNHHQICTSGERKMQCSDCGDSFSSTASLKSHLRSCPKTQCLKCAENVSRESFADHMVRHLPEAWSLRLYDSTVEMDRNRTSNEADLSVLKLTGNTGQDEEKCSEQSNPAHNKKLQRKKKRRSKHWGRKRYLRTSSKPGTNETKSDHISVSDVDSNSLDLNTSEFVLPKEAPGSTSIRNTTYFSEATDVEIFMQPKSPETDASYELYGVKSPFSLAEESVDLDCFPCLITEHFEVENGFSELELRNESESFFKDPIMHNFNADIPHPAIEETCLRAKNTFSQEVTEPKDGSELTLTIVNVEGEANLFSWDDESDFSTGITDDKVRDNRNLTSYESHSFVDTDVHEQRNQEGKSSPSTSHNEDCDSGIDATEDSSSQDKTEDFYSCITSITSNEVTQQNQNFSVCGKDHVSDLTSNGTIDLGDEKQRISPLTMCKHDSSPIDIIQTDSTISDDVLCMDESVSKCVEDASPNNIIISNAPKMSSAVYFSSSVCENEVVVQTIASFEDAKLNRKYSVLKEHNYALPEGQTVPWFVRQAVRNKLKAKSNNLKPAANGLLASLIETSAQSLKKRTKSSTLKQVKDPVVKQTVMKTNAHEENFSANPKTLQLQGADTVTSFMPKTRKCQVVTSSILVKDKVKHCKQEKLNLLVHRVPSTAVRTTSSLTIPSSNVSEGSHVLSLGTGRALSQSNLQSSKLKASQNLSQDKVQSTNSKDFSFAQEKDAQTIGRPFVDRSTVPSKSGAITTKSLPPAPSNLSSQCLELRLQKTLTDPLKKFIKQEKSKITCGFKPMATILPRKENISQLFSLQKNSFNINSLISGPNCDLGNQPSVKATPSMSRNSTDVSMTTNTMVFIVTSDGSLIPHPKFMSSQSRFIDQSKENLCPALNVTSEAMVHDANAAEPCFNEETNNLTQLNIISSQGISPQTFRQELGVVRTVFSSLSSTKDCVTKTTSCQHDQGEGQLNEDNNDLKLALSRALKSTAPNIRQSNDVLVSDAESEKGKPFKVNSDQFATEIFKKTGLASKTPSKTRGYNERSEAAINPYIVEDDSSKRNVVTTSTILVETNCTLSEVGNSSGKSTIQENLLDLEPSVSTFPDPSSCTVLADDKNVDTNFLGSSHYCKKINGHSQDVTLNPSKPFEVVDMNLHTNVSPDPVQIKDLGQRAPCPSLLCCRESPLMKETVEIKDVDQSALSSSLLCSKGKSPIEETSLLNNAVENPGSELNMASSKKYLLPCDTICKGSPCLESPKLNIKEIEIFQEKVGDLPILRDSQEDATLLSHDVLQEENDLFNSFISASEEEVMEAVQLAVSQLFETQTYEETATVSDVKPIFLVDDSTSVNDSHSSRTAECQNSNHKLHESSVGCVQTNNSEIAGEKTASVCCGNSTLSPDRLEGERKPLKSRKRLSCIWSPALYPSRKLMSGMRSFRRTKYGRQGRQRTVAPDKFSCINCSEWFYRSSDLQNHVCLVALLREKFLFENSDKILELRTDFIEQRNRTENVSETSSPFETFLCLKTHEKKRWYNCDKCVMRCRSFSALLDHKAMVHTEKLFLQCHVCGKEFSRLQRLAVHFAKSHKVNSKYSELNRLAAEDKREQETTTVDCHAQEAPGNTQQKTQLIDFTTSPPSKRKSGEIASEQAKAPEILPGELNSCHVCNKTFSGKSGLVSHMNQAHAPVYKCPVCFRRYTYPDRLKTHFMQHMTLPGIADALPLNPKQANAESTSCPLLSEKNDNDTAFLNSKCDKKRKALNSDKDVKKKKSSSTCQKMVSEREVSCDDGGENDRHDDANLVDIANGTPESEVSCTGLASISAETETAERCASNSTVLTSINGDSSVAVSNLFHVGKDKHKKTKRMIVPSPTSDENCSPGKHSKSRRPWNGSSFQDGTNHSSVPLVHSLSTVQRPQHKCDVCKESFKKKLLFVQHRVNAHKNVPFSCTICLVTLSDLDGLDIHLDQCKALKQSNMVKHHDTAHCLDPSAINQDILQPDGNETSSANPPEQEKIELKSVHQQNVEIPLKTGSHQSSEKKTFSMNTESPYCDSLLTTMSSDTEAINDLVNRCADGQFKPDNMMAVKPTDGSSSSEPDVGRILPSNSGLNRCNKKGKIKKCVKCDKLFRRDIDLFRHKKRFHKKPAVVCEVCQLHIGNYKLLKIHQSKVHTVSSQWCLLSDPNQPLSINSGEDMTFNARNTSSATSAFKDDLARENFFLEESTLFNCSDCPLTYRSLSCLKRHRILVHSEPTNYYCDTCGKGFSYPHSLKNHAMTHSRGVWKSKRTQKASDLDDSDDGTSVQRPYKKVCPGSFQDSRDLNKNCQKEDDSSVPCAEEHTSVIPCSVDVSVTKEVIDITCPSAHHGMSSPINCELPSNKLSMEGHYGESTQSSALSGEDNSRNILPIEGSNMVQKTAPLSCELIVHPTLNVIQNTFNYPNPINPPYCMEHLSISKFGNSDSPNSRPAAYLPYQTGSKSPVQSVPISLIDQLPVLYNPGLPISSFELNSALDSKLTGFWGDGNSWTQPFQDFKSFNSCTLCGLCLPSWFALQEHHYLAHSVPDMCMNVPLQQQYQTLSCSDIVSSGFSNPPQPQLTTESFSSRGFGEETSSFAELKSHSVVHCPVCGACFPSLLSLQDHYKLHEPCL